MIKWLLVIGVVAAIYFLFIKKSSNTSQCESGETPPKKDAGQDVEEMVECSRCGIYVEVDEAILSSGKYYCSKECLKG